MAIKVADEVWIATALLHKEFPDRDYFRQSEIIDKVAEKNIFGRMRPGVIIHTAIHCVANKKPNPGIYRMLYATEEGRRRLYRKGDDYHPWREGGKMVPKSDEIPEEYKYLIDWWNNEYNKK